MRRSFPETCSLRWSDKENITCSLAGCRHGWAEWCKVGVAQCLDTVTCSKFWKHFKYKPFYSVKWPTWKLSRASKFAPFCGSYEFKHRASEKRFPSLEGRWDPRKNSTFPCFLQGLKAPFLGKASKCKYSGACLLELGAHAWALDFAVQLSSVGWY